MNCCTRTRLMFVDAWTGTTALRLAATATHLEEGGCILSSPRPSAATAHHHHAVSRGVARHPRLQRACLQKSCGGESLSSFFSCAHCTMCPGRGIAGLSLRQVVILCVNKDPQMRRLAHRPPNASTNTHPSIVMPLFSCSCFSRSSRLLWPGEPNSEQMGGTGCSRCPSLCAWQNLP
jgi:hypothetical protein